MKDKIIITVEGGLVQEITDIPDQCIVEVRGYDMQDGDNTETDEDGKEYVSQEYSGGS